MTRRFGMCFLTTEAELPQHPRLRHLGPEPLSEAFSGAYLLGRQGLHKPVKNFVMDAAVVVGVGNIYASESLFLAGSAPRVRSDVCVSSTGSGCAWPSKRSCKRLLTTTARAFQTM